MTQILDIKTVGDLKASGYTPRSIQDELRNNLIEKIQRGENIYSDIYGYEETVIPNLERALLARHHILLLGLRGQAKTRMARQLTQLLDPYIPVIRGSEINDDPLQPISRHGRDLIEEQGDDTPIDWLHRSDRYVEKLATPDVSIADLIGDVDPIKAATLKLPYSDERVIHFGLVARAHRCLFVINELPDLQARIQVALFNILEEGDLQIRGFKLRLPLDISFLFTANPEDYTQRGSIITPLKDRIPSQIITHYPQDISIGRQITAQESRIDEAQQAVQVPLIMKNLIEEVVVAARQSEYVDEASGVSARVAIAAYENLVSAAERRMLLQGQIQTVARITDLWSIVPALTGKLELVYEGEQEGVEQVARHIIRSGIKKCFDTEFPSPDAERDPYAALKLWMEDGHSIELRHSESDESYGQALDTVPGLNKIIDRLSIEEDERNLYKELILHGLAAHQIILETQRDDSIRWNNDLNELLDDLN